MGNPAISVLIPYRRRLANVRTAFAALADQTMDRSQFEVVIGAIEHAPEFTQVVAEYADRLDIVTVTSGGGWNVSRARNQAIPVLRGEVMLSIDVDMVLPPSSLATLYDRYFADGQDVCVLGQMLGYDDELTETDLGDSEVEVKPYEHYRDLCLRLEAEGVDRPEDRVFVDPLPLPWPLVWGGFAALRTDTIRRHDLTFDEQFRGWGAEDQEWGYRIQATGTPIIMSREVWAVHAHHARDAAANRESYEANMRHFLTKSPTLDVEMARAFSWDKANVMWEDVQREVAAARGAPAAVGVVRGPGAGRPASGKLRQPWSRLPSPSRPGGRSGWRRGSSRGGSRRSSGP